MRRPSLNLSGGFLLVSFTELILCSPSFRDNEINSTINWENSPSLRDVEMDSPSLRDAKIDSTINMDMGYDITIICGRCSPSLAIANATIFTGCVGAAVQKALSFCNAKINSKISPSVADD